MAKKRKLPPRGKKGQFRRRRVRKLTLKRIKGALRARVLRGRSLLVR